MWRSVDRPKLQPGTPSGSGILTSQPSVLNFSSLLFSSTCRKEFEVALYHYEAAVKHADEDLAQVRGAAGAFLRSGSGAGKGGRRGRSTNQGLVQAKGAGMEPWRGIHRANGPAALLRSTQLVASPLLNPPPFPPPSSRMPSSTFRS